MSQIMNQEKVNELVDRFYDRLMKDDYYITMFKARNVDIELLKNRQRIFINRLVSEETSNEHENQVKDRHPFQIAPDRAEMWFNNLKETMDEMELNSAVKGRLIEKIELLLIRLLNKN
ncbi:MULTISPECIES: globin domain-containing protein [Neobacillus]|uniref:Globin-sensor domain-containing protein n=1 Tax=Neobacillus rhizophilus TaxID=2833579 RepID=A0A942U113_9BACI|nr:MULTISPECIES: hypothetical protein [Neobacillus]MBS4210923.1 hypothetical protein [Neobacillus rhizophilus]